METGNGFGQGLSPSDSLLSRKNEEDCEAMKKLERSNALQAESANDVPYELTCRPSRSPSEVKPNTSTRGDRDLLVVIVRPERIGAVRVLHRSPRAGGVFHLGDLGPTIRPFLT